MAVTKSRSLIPSIGQVTSFWRVLREVDPQEIIAEAEQTLYIVIAGRPGSGRATLGTQLAGHAPDAHSAAWRALHAVTLEADGSLPAVMPVANLYIYVHDATAPATPADRAALKRLRQGGRKLLHVVTKIDLAERPNAVMTGAREQLGLALGDEVAFVNATDEASVQREVIPALLRLLPEMTLALARTFPKLREPIAEQLVVDTARANAEFALVSSLPSNIPILGGVLSAGTDLLVLTKNQAMLVFKLAAVYGRSLDSRAQLGAEIAPVIGAAFVWRTIARSLVALVPGIFAAVPKAGIAFVGTFVTGRTAQYYYRWGRRPPATVLSKFSADATEVLKQRFASFLLRKK